MSGRKKGSKPGRGRKVLGKGVRKTHPATNPTLRFVKSGAFVPSTFRTSLRFALNFAATASSSSAIVFMSGNNLNDPGLSSSSAKCVGYTYLAAMYNRYRVVGSRIKVKGLMSSSTAGATNTILTGSIAVWPGNKGSAPTLYRDGIAQPYSKWMDITMQTPKSITSTMTTAKITGQKDLLGSDRTQAIINAAPAEEWYWNVMYVSEAAFTNGQLIFDIELTYDVIFMDRQDLDHSLVKMFDEVHAYRCKQLADWKQPQNVNPPYNKAKMLDHQLGIDIELKEIEEYRKRENMLELKKVVVEEGQEMAVPGRWLKDTKSMKDDNYTIHDKWLKLREADVHARTPNPTPKSSSQK